jgi:hypothetical protein
MASKPRPPSIMSHAVFDKLVSSLQPNEQPLLYYPTTTMAVH